MVFNLDDKIALITGSSSGVGAATSILFSSLGAQVVIVGRRQEQLDQVAREVAAKSPKNYKHAMSWSYCMTKAAMDMLTKTLVQKLAPDIRVNSVNPGIIKTDFSRDFAASDETYEMLKKLSPLKRIGEAIDIAKLIAYLSSDAAKFMTASLIFADGGALFDDPYSTVIKLD